MGKFPKMAFVLHQRSLIVLWFGNRAGGGVGGIQERGKKCFWDPLWACCQNWPVQLSQGQAGGKSEAIAVYNMFSPCWHLNNKLSSFACLTFVDAAFQLALVEGEVSSPDQSWTQMEVPELNAFTFSVYSGYVRNQWRYFRDSVRLPAMAKKMVASILVLLATMAAALATRGRFWNSSL